MIVFLVGFNKWLTIIQVSLTQGQVNVKPTGFPCFLKFWKIKKAKIFYDLISSKQIICTVMISF